MNESAISWTTVTWNPISGCSKISEGCKHCYAERLSLERGWTHQPWTPANEAANIVLKPHRLREPYKLKGSARVFVNSMSDLFHSAIPDSYIIQAWQVMVDLPQHTFQILTKRPERMATWSGPWRANIWAGTSIENARNLHRLETLRQCNAQIRFVSFEPLLGPIGPVDLTGVHWVIVGGESGPGYRPMDHAWARELRDQCVAQGVAYFFKQSAAHRTEMGTLLIEEDGSKTLWQQYPTPPAPQPEAAINQLLMF